MKLFKLNLLGRIKRLRYKLLIPVLVAVGLLYFLAVGYFITRIYFLRQNDTKRYIESLAVQHANKVSNELIRYYNISETTARFLEDMQYVDSTLIRRIDKGAMVNILENNPDFHAVWISRQFFSYKDNWEKPYGRSRVTAFFSEETGEIDTEVVYLDFKGESGLYEQIHLENKDVILNPYIDAVGDYDSIWMTSVAIPIRRQGEFIGLAGIDVTLRRITDLVEQIDDYMGSSSFLVSPDGRYIAHNDASFYGKEVDSVALGNRSLSETIQKGENFAVQANDGEEEHFIAYAKVNMGVDSPPWMLGISVPLTNINHEARQALWEAILIGLIGLVVMFFIILRIANVITNPIKNGIRFAERIARGDLTTKLEVEGNDEIAQFSNNLNKMSEQIRSIVEQIQKMSVALSESSDFLQSTSDKLAGNANKQASSSEEVAASMEVMVTSIEENSKNSLETRSVSVKAAGDAENSERAVLRSEEIMNLIAEKIQVINEIAFQVHILSLNTAIEAAHAGEYGAGFTTIAREIRSLAEKSQKSADEILSLTAESVKASQESASALKDLAPKIINASELMSRVSDAGKEQTLGANQINNAIASLNSVVQQNSSFAANISERASSLQQQVNELNQLVTIFKTE